MTSPIPLRGDRALSLLNIGPDGSCPTLGHCTQPSLFLLRPLAHTSTADTCEAVRGRSKIASPSPARASQHINHPLFHPVSSCSHFVLSVLIILVGPPVNPISLASLPPCHHQLLHPLFKLDLWRVGFSVRFKFSFAFSYSRSASALLVLRFG